MELLIVIGIMSILAAIGFASYAGFKNRQTVETDAEKIMAILRETMELGRSQADGNQWGLHLDNPTGNGNDFYEIWKGSSYASGTVTQRINLSGNSRFNDPAEGVNKNIIFQKATGLPTASSSVVIESLSGGGSATINIDSTGRVDYTLN